MLRDLIVVGMEQDRIRRRLLAERTLTFSSAKDIAIAMECADKNAADIARSIAYQPGADLSFVNRVEQHPIRKSDAKTPGNCLVTGAGKCCFRCNGEHSRTMCRFKNSACNYCHKVGHIASACLSQKRRARRGMQNPPP